DLPLGGLTVLRRTFHVERGAALAHDGEVARGRGLWFVGRIQANLATPAVDVLQQRPDAVLREAGDDYLALLAALFNEQRVDAHRARRRIFRPTRGQRAPVHLLCSLHRRT